VYILIIATRQPTKSPRTPKKTVKSYWKFMEKSTENTGNLLEIWWPKFVDTLDVNNGLRQIEQ
jgi:hypothetical protein